MKRGNQLENLQNVKAPESLKIRTRQAAQELREGVGTARRSPRRFGGKRLAAAVCALAVFVGGAAVWHQGRPESAPGGAAILNSFGLVAYAADTGEIMEPHGSTIVFSAALGGVDDPEKGFFSGCEFKITGDNIASVSASMDKGGLYRSKREHIEQSDVEDVLRGLVPLSAGADQVTVLSDSEADKLWADVSYLVENGFTEPYDPEAHYGFWGEPRQPDDEADLQESWHTRVDEFEGAKLTVTVTFDDGSQQTQTMTLHTGKLGVEYPDDTGNRQLTGEVLTDEQAAEEGYVYGVYAEIE